MTDYYAPTPIWLSDLEIKKQDDHVRKYSSYKEDQQYWISDAVTQKYEVFAKTAQWNI